MTVNDCYDKMGANYQNVLGRFGSESMVKRFALKFLPDDSFDQLKDALVKQDAETAFRAAHTLKGLCMNLGFDSLYEVSSALTENLRGRQLNGWESLFEKVEQRYLIVREALEELQASEQMEIETKETPYVIGIVR